jgi:hypothetical protein
MLENALRSLCLFNIFVSWHFNITTLMNPSGHSFKPRHEQDHFSYEDLLDLNSKKKRIFF